MKSELDYLSDYIDQLQSKGRYTFSRKQIYRQMEKSEAAFNLALHRLIKKGRIKRLLADFYIIVPLEYQTIGSLPPSWFIDAFMRSMQIDYYVSLLSAAALHGATHQQVIAFQVIANKVIRPITLGQVRLEVHFQKIIPINFLSSVKTETGTMLISTPEVTICDLIKFINFAGQIHNVATILCELKEKFSITSLMHYIETGLVATTYVQRLGYLLDYLDLGLDTQPLQRWVNTKHPDYRPLAMGSNSPIIEKNQRWHILVNEQVETDL